MYGISQFGYLVASALFMGATVYAPVAATLGPDERQFTVVFRPNVSGSFQLQFEDKNELIFAVCERQFERLDRVTEEAAAASDDPLESLRLRGKAYVRFGLENPEHYRILFMGKAKATPEEFDDERLRVAASFDHLVGAVQRCMDAGEIPHSDAFFVALGMWIAVHGLTSLLIAKPDFPWPGAEDLVDHFCSVHVAGLRRMADSAS